MTGRKYCAWCDEAVLHTYEHHCPVCGRIRCSESRCVFELNHLYRSFYNYLARTKP